MSLSLRRMLVLAILLISLASIPMQVMAITLGTEVFRGAAIGTAVAATAPQLNKFVNTVTFQGTPPRGLSTKVVPILSVGEKGYVGAAQIAGPAADVNRTKAVWAYDDNFSGNEFRLRILVPTASYNPLQLSKVQRVGITAVIDVSLNGQWKGETYSRSIGAGDVIKAAAVAAAINAAANPINKAINVVTGGAEGTTKVVPIISVGEKAYIGGVQVAGSRAAVAQVKAGYQYEAAFDTGKYRIKAFVPSGSLNPIKISRVQGVGITAIIDTSIAQQERVRERQVYWQTVKANYRPMGTSVKLAFEPERLEAERRDRGLHKGWYKGKGNLKHDHDVKRSQAPAKPVVRIDIKEKNDDRGKGKAKK